MAITTRELAGVDAYHHAVAADNEQMGSTDRFPSLERRWLALHDALRPMSGKPFGRRSTYSKISLENKLAWQTTTLSVRASVRRPEDSVDAPVCRRNRQPAAGARA